MTFADWPGAMSHVKPVGNFGFKFALVPRGYRVQNRYKLQVNLTQIIL